MPHFFISYAKKDTRDLALALNDALNAIPGVTAWVDKSLRAGRAWAAQIEEQIDLCDVMVVLISPDLNRHKQGLDESYVLSEITYAKYTKRKMIIPVMVLPTDIPIDLARVQYIDFTIPGLKLADLVSAICDDAGVSLSAAVPPAPTVQQPADPLQAALERARSFKGTRNRDWTPYIHTFEAQGIPFEMCLVPPGTFQMGSNERDSEKPIHPQILTKPYWIARHPVTNAQWRLAVERSGGAIAVPKDSDWYNDLSKADQPVVGVTWFQCREFMKWLGGQWRLSTEAEWEYSARGVESLIYPWGNDWHPDRVVFKENSNGSTAAVGGRPTGSSWIGAEDMSGNVWEWQSNLYREYPYNGSDGREDLTNTSNARCLRGGSWDDDALYARASFRYRYYPLNRDFIIGFRVVLLSLIF